MHAYSVVCDSLWPHGTAACQTSFFMEFSRQEYSRGSSWPRDQTRISWVSCFDRQILYHWATWESNQLVCWYMSLLPQLLMRSVLTRHQTSSSWISTDSLHFVSELKICISLLLFQMVVIVLLAKILERKLVAFRFWDEWEIRIRTIASVLIFRPNYKPLRYILYRKAISIYKYYF